LEKIDEQRVEFEVMYRTKISSHVSHVFYTSSSNLSVSVVYGYSSIDSMVEKNSILFVHLYELRHLD
jgi:hypothetical protein